MPRNMSFSLTTAQFLDGSKDVTRRNGWLRLQPGDLFWGVEKAMGLRKGEKVVRLGLCRCVSNEHQPLDTITQEDVVREGFPGWTPAQFVEMYRKANRCPADQVVSRIEFTREPWWVNVTDEPLVEVCASSPEAAVQTYIDSQPDTCRRRGTCAHSGAALPRLAPDPTDTDPCERYEAAEVDPYALAPGLRDGGDDDAL